MHTAQYRDDLIQKHTFAAQFLRTIGIVPDCTVGQFALYFLKPFPLTLVVKDTPEARILVRRGLLIPPSKQ